MYQIADWYPIELQNKISDQISKIFEVELKYHKHEKIYQEPYIYITIPNQPESFVLIDRSDDDIFEYIIVRFEENTFNEVSKVFKIIKLEAYTMYPTEDKELNYTNNINDETHESNIRLQKYKDILSK